MSDRTCRHHKLVFTQDDGLVLGCPGCGREWIAYRRADWKIDYSAMGTASDGMIRLDPQNEVRGDG